LIVDRLTIIPARALTTLAALPTLTALRLLPLHTRHSAPRAHAIQLFLLTRLHRRDIEDRYRVSLIQSRHNFRHIEVAHAKSHNFRDVLAVVDEENHSSPATASLPTAESTLTALATLRTFRLGSSGLFASTL